MIIFGNLTPCASSSIPRHFLKAHVLTEDENFSDYGERQRVSSMFEVDPSIYAHIEFESLVVRGLFEVGRSFDC